MYWSRDGLAGLDAYILRAGDVVLGLDRPIIGLGVRVAQIKDADVPALLLQRVARIRATERADQRFIVYVLASPLFQAYVEPIFTGISVPHMSEGQLRDFRIPLPPVSEQRLIADCLDKQIAKIDALIEEAQRFIELSRERRSALISAAVTGQIDVREEWAAW